MKFYAFALLSLTSVSLFAPSTANAAALIEEGFNYAEQSNLATVEPLYVVSSGTQPTTVTAACALTRPGVAQIGGKGLQFRHQAASSQDVTRNVSGLNSADGTSVYASCQFRVDTIETTTSAGADATFTIASTGTIWPTRMNVNATTNTTSYDLGVASNSPTTTIYSPDSLNLQVGQTYFIVIGIDLVAGASNNVSKLWINPPANQSIAPAPTVSAVNTGLSEPAAPTGFGIRQGSNQRMVMSIDEIRMGNTWADVTPAPASVDGWSLY